MGYDEKSIPIFNVIMEVMDLSQTHSYSADKHDFPLQLSGAAPGSLLQQFSKKPATNEMMSTTILQVTPVTIFPHCIIFFRELLDETRHF